MMLLLILTMPINGVAAQSGCDQLIADDAGVFGGNISEVQSALNDLARYAEVRVITIQSYGNSTLDAYVDGIRQQCPSWQATDGGFKNNLIVFAISYDDQDTGIFYGNQWADPLDSNWTRIVSDYMNPRFGDGDFSGGFVAGINEVNRLIDLKIHPPAQAPVQSGPVVITQQEATDYSGFYRFLIIAAILIALGALIYFGAIWYNQWAKENEKRKRAQQRAKLRKQALTSGIAEWRASVEAVETDILGLSEAVDETVTNRLTSMVREAQVVFEKMLRRYNGLDSSAGDPDTDGLTAGQYDAMETAYAEVLALLQEAQEELAEAVTEHAKVQESSDKAPEALQQAENAMKAALRAVEEMTAQEFIIPTDILAPAERLLALARKASENKRPDLTYQRATEAADLAKEVTQQVRALPSRHEAVAAFAKSLPALIEKLKARVTDGRKLFDEMDDVYPEDALEPIAKNGSEAEKRVRALEDMLDDLLEFIEKQHYEKAEALVARGTTWAEEIDSFMRSIAALKKSLDDAARACKKELDDAAADIMKAQSFLTAHKADLEDAQFDALKNAEKALREAMREMDEAMPNPILVVKFARSANEQADAVLASARAEAEKTVRLRAKAETALREAERLVSKAQEYIEDHSSDVGANAKANLRKARENLVTAREASDFERCIAFSEGAEEKARYAYNEAKEDVAEANEADDDGDTTVVIWGNSTPVYQPSTRRESTSTWSAPTPRSSSGGGSVNWGSSSQRGSSVNVTRSSMGGGSKKW